MRFAENISFALLNVSLFSGGIALPRGKAIAPVQDHITIVGHNNVQKGIKQKNWGLGIYHR